MLNRLASFLPMGASETHKVVEVLSLKDFAADSRQKGAAEESVVLGFFEVDDPIANSGGSELVFGRLFACSDAKGNVFQRELRVIGSGEETDQILSLHRLYEKDMMNNKSKDNHQL